MKLPFSAVLISALAASPALADRLIVVNKGADTAALVDSATLDVEAIAPTGENPHEVAVSPDGARAYVTDYGNAEGDSITVLDLTTGEVAGAWNLGDHRGPHGVWVSAGLENDLVWATTEGTGTVLEIDAETGGLLRHWETGQEVSHMVTPLPDYSKLYIANIGSGSVSVIDRSDDSVTTVPTGAGAEGIDVAPNGSEVWVTNRDAGTISIIDPATDTVTETFSSGGDVPIRIKFTPDGSRAYVSNAGSNAVTVFDAETREQLATIDVGAIPVGILMDPDGGRAFVANTQDDRITVIDTDSDAVTGDFTTGDEPDGMAWIPDNETDED